MKFRTVPLYKKVHFSDFGVILAKVAFSGLEEALRVLNSDLRLFGKPESFIKRRMGVAVAR